MVAGDVTSHELNWRYAGWRVVVMSAVAAMAGFATVLIYSFSILLKPLSAEFGWSRGAISGAFACASFTLGLCSPGLGVLLDKFGPRRVILPSIAIFGIAMLSLASLSNLVQLYITFIVIGAVGNATAQMGYARAVSTWFADHRGLALAFLMGGAGIGTIVIPVVTQRSIEAFGWRGTYGILGVLPLVIALPLVALFVKEKDEEPRSSRPDSLSQLPGMEVRDALRGRSFWLLSGTLFLTAISTTGSVTHFSALLSDQGVSPAQAALAVSLVGACGILGRFTTGWLLDRFFGPLIGMTLIFMTALSMAILSSAKSLPAALIAGVLLGFSMGGETDVAPYLLARYFGLRRLGTLYGLTWTAYATAAALGSVLLGRAFDSHGSYESLLMILASLTFVAGLLMISLPRYPQSLKPAKTAS